jgi:hypothetical protein
MLSGEAEPFLDDFAVTGTSLLYCDKAQIGEGLTSTHPRARGNSRTGGGPAPSLPIREERTGRGNVQARW